jgi:hypothetical protein
MRHPGGRWAVRAAATPGSDVGDGGDGAAQPHPRRRPATDAHVGYRKLWNRPRHRSARWPIALRARYCGSTTTTRAGMASRRPPGADLGSGLRWRRGDFRPRSIPTHARAEGIIECGPTWRSFASHDLLYRLTWHVAVGCRPSIGIFFVIGNEVLI